MFAILFALAFTGLLFWWAEGAKWRARFVLSLIGVGMLSLGVAGLVIGRYLNGLILIAFGAVQLRWWWTKEDMRLGIRKSRANR